MQQSGAAKTIAASGAGLVVGGAIGALVAGRPAEAAPVDEKLDYIVECQTTIVQLMGRAVASLEAIAAAGGITIPGAISAVTLSPEAIIDFMQVGTPKGQIQVIGFAVPIACSAGGTTTWQFRLPSGWVSVARTPYRFTSDYYSPDLTVEVRVEEEMRPITWGALPMTGPREVLVDFILKRYGMDVIIVNNTATDAVITGEATVVWLEKSYCDEVYLPLLRALYQAAEGVAR